MRSRALCRALWALLLSTNNFLLPTSAFSSVVVLPPRFLQFENDICTRQFSDGERQFSMRNVRGDGNCMLQACHLAAEASVFASGGDFSVEERPDVPRKLRKIIANILSNDGTLYIENDRLVSTRALLESSARAEGLRPREYLNKLVVDGPEGGLFCGGPELTVLSNIYRRPISIYEVDATLTSEMINSMDGTEVIPIEKKGTFGKPLFQDPLAKDFPDSAVVNFGKEWHIHILVLDVSPSEKHACVLLPET